MKEWLRRVDPGFYLKEPHLLRTQAQIPRYPDEAQAHVRLNVLTADGGLHAATMIVALAAYATVTGAGALDVRGDWPAVWAFAVLAVAVPRALPWWPRADGSAALRHALIGIALIAVPAFWTRMDFAVLGIALLVGITLYVTGGRDRFAILVLAVGVLFGVRMGAHPVLIAVLVGVLASGAAVLGIRLASRVWRVQPQMVTWAALATLLLACAYAFAFNTHVIASRLPAEIAAMAVAYLGVCIIAGRIRRAELLARPDGVLSIPQSIVPLLDRSHDHAIICWLT